MMYPVTCECGTIRQVSGTDAGTTYRCKCGREIDIPALHIRRQSGESFNSPELTIELLLKEGKLPDGKQCVKCSTITDHICRVDVFCERNRVQLLLLSRPAAFFLF